MAIAVRATDSKGRLEDSQDVVMRITRLEERLEAVA